jgi:hypothetical protein
MVASTASGEAKSDVGKSMITPATVDHLLE